MIVVTLSDIFVIGYFIVMLIVIAIIKHNN